LEVGQLKFRILILVAILLSATLARAQETVTIDLSVNNGPATYRASGYLHGFNNTVPSNSIVTPVKPQLMRSTEWYENDDAYSRVVGMGAVPMFILSDAWANEEGGYPINPCPTTCGPGSAWYTWVTNKVNAYPGFVWDIFNEPDWGGYFNGSEAQFQNGWASARAAIKAVNGSLIVVGPSTTHWDSWSTDFMAFAKANAILPDEVAFHELDNVPTLVSEIAAARSYMTANGISIPNIDITEYVDQGSAYIVGTLVQYIAALERAQVHEAAHSCWDNNACNGPSLDGAVNGSTINGIWYDYQSYAQITGTIVGVTPSATVDGVFGASASPCKASGLFGRNGATSTVTYTFTNISTNYACLNVGGNVQAAVYTLANDNGSGSGGPVLLSNAPVAVSGNEISVTVPNMGTNDAAIIQLTPAGGGGTGGLKTYYVDYVTGSDTAVGTSKLAPWKYAPGMNGGCGSGTQCGNTVLNAGDSVIFKGGVTWPNSAFAWTIPYAGTSGNPIYFGVDQTWYTGESWTRPIMNLGGAVPNNNSAYTIVSMFQPYVTLDNFEWIGILAAPSPVNGSTTLFGWGNNGVHVQNMYVHGWINPYFSVGTGTLTSGSYTITNYVPFSYSPAPSPSWVGLCGGSSNCTTQVQSLTGYIPEGNATPSATNITATVGGSYSITFVNNCAGTPVCYATASGTHVIGIGQDDFHVNGQGSPGPEVDEVFGPGNYIDGSDTAEAQLNPYGDCGLTEGNNNICVSSATILWRGPNIVRDNVILFDGNSIAVGGCQEYSGNLILYLRNSTNPTAHTNGIECTDDFAVNGQTYFFGNVVKHGTNPNPSTPGGPFAIGLGAILSNPEPGETAYWFNNVFTDVLANAPFERATTTGIQYIFNNTADCGIAFTSPPFNSFCYNAQPVDFVQNNHFITQFASSGIGAVVSGSPTFSTNLTMLPATATSDGYTTVQQYVYSPTSSGSPTVGVGTSVATICGGITQIAAQTACLSDTPYAVGYNTTGHVVIIPDRTPVARPSTPDIGAYQFVGGSPAPAVTLAPTSLSFANQVVGTMSASQTVKITNSGTATLNITSIALGGTNPADFAETNNCTPTLAAGSFCNILVTFTPVSAASFSATVVFTTNASTSPDSAAITGTGVSSGAPAVTLSVSTLTFGNQAVGTPSAKQTVTLTNSGTASLLISSIGLTGTNPGDFGQTNTCPPSLPAMANCVISVGFLPISAASFTANVSIADNASGTPHTIALSGTGTAVVAGQVIMSNPVSAHFSGSATYTFTIPAPMIGDAEVCEIDGFANVTVSSIAHGADSFTQATSARSTNANGTTYTWSDIWYKLGMGNAGTSVTLTLSGTSGGDYHCQELSGGSISFVAALGYTNHANTTNTVVPGPSATLSGTNGFLVGVMAQASASVTGTVASGGVTFSVSDLSSGNAAVNLLNVPAATYAPSYQLNAIDNTISSSTAGFSATGGPIPPHLNKVILN
jgi:hypothetical protein